MLKYSSKIWQLKQYGFNNPLFRLTTKSLRLIHLSSRWNRNQNQFSDYECLLLTFDVVVVAGIRFDFPVYFYFENAIIVSISCNSSTLTVGGERCSSVRNRIYFFRCTLCGVLNKNTNSSDSSRISSALQSNKECQRMLGFDCKGTPEQDWFTVSSTRIVIAFKMPINLLARRSVVNCNYLFITATNESFMFGNHFSQAVTFFSFQFSKSSACDPRLFFRPKGQFIQLHKFTPGADSHKLVGFRCVPGSTRGRWCDAA